MASNGHAIRGSRVGGEPSNEMERGEAAPRVKVSYWCVNGHETTPSFSVGNNVEAPLQWECLRCGAPAGLDPTNPPVSVKNEPYKTHLAYVKERRSDEDGALLLEEALENLSMRRGFTR